MKAIHLIFCTLAITLVACDNNDDTSSCESSLPPVTTTGANTFGACVNGKLLIPRSGGGSFGTTPDAASFYGGYPNSTDYYELDIRDLVSPRLSSIFIHIHNVDSSGLGFYTINESNGQRNIDGFSHTYLHCRVFDDKTKQYQDYRSFEESGSVEIIHYDLNNRLISGIFEGKVVNSANPSDTLQIKKGRFDLNWRTLPNITFP